MLENSRSSLVDFHSIWDMFDINNIDNSESESLVLLQEEIIEDAAYYHNRFLMSSLDGQGDYDVGEGDYDAAAFAGSQSTPGDYAMDNNQAAASTPPVAPPLQPYTLEDTLAESNLFAYTFTLVVYDPQEDNFMGLYNKDHKWKAGNKKLWKSMRYMTYMLRRLFPERFTKDSPELVFAVGSGDYPHVRPSKLPHAGGVAPVLMFGSAFRDPGMYSNMMAMPMPEQHHLFCFQEWLDTGRVCKEMRARNSPLVERVDQGELVFGEEYGLEWHDLIPQLVWRGTDFGFLPTIQDRPSLVHPNSKTFVRTGQAKGNNLVGIGDNRVDAIQALNEKYDTLLPRWKGAALTAEAELQAHGTGKLPWANIKFSAYLEAGKSATVGSLKYKGWESVGIGVDKGMPLTDLAKYKYHIDLGGGGGTTWSGTIEKLAMPGLLFHHLTPTKDYIHDRLRPWKHYIPVSSDLLDLKRKFDWAESHPQQSKRIADAGTAFMRHLGTPEGFGRMFQEDFVEPMRRVIEAYQPVASTHPGMTSWKDVLQSMEDCRVIPVMECSGMELKGSCHLVGGDDVMKWSKGMYYKGPK